MHSEKQTTDRAIALFKAGKPYADIAATLNKEGHKTGGAAAFSMPTVSALLVKNGFRRKSPQVRPSRGQRRQRTTPQSTSSKYDVLKAIEDCAGLTLPVRKALLGLVWQELNK